MFWPDLRPVCTRTTYSTVTKTFKHSENCSLQCFGGLIVAVARGIMHAGYTLFSLISPKVVLAITNMLYNMKLKLMKHKYEMLPF